MIITCDRQDGIFTPQMSDRINVKSTALWEKIQNINVTPIWPKLSCKVENINYNDVIWLNSVDDAGFVINDTLHIVNFTMRFNSPVNLTTFTRIGSVTIAPITDVVMQYDDGRFLIKVPKGQTTIYAYGNLSTVINVYFYYVT